MGPAKVRPSDTSVRDLLADRRFTEAVLGFLTTTKLGVSIVIYYPLQPKRQRWAFQLYTCILFTDRSSRS